MNVKIEEKTFSEYRHSQDQSVQPKGHNVEVKVGEHVSDPRDTEEEVHGAVLPVHELRPMIFMVEVQVRPIWNKLLCQDPNDCKQSLDCTFNDLNPLLLLAQSGPLEALLVKVLQRVLH